MRKELTALYYISDFDEEGNETIIKEDIPAKIDLEATNIEIIEECIDSKGNIVKNRCNITTSWGRQITLAHAYKEIQMLKQGFDFNQQ